MLRRESAQIGGGERADDDGGADDAELLVGVEAAGGEEEAAERERPEQVELFFDGERPELQDGVGGDVRAEVAGCLVDEVPVRDVQERGFE